MKTSERSVALSFLAAVFIMAQMLGGEALAQSSYYTGQGCNGCHTSVVTCNGCHGHGAHPSSAKNAINVAGTTNKSSYAPGETVTVTITGGYRTGWFRAVLYNQNMVELARSTGNDSGVGSSTTYPATLSAPAPTSPGSYNWKVAWYGNQYDSGGATFGSGWTPDANNPDHGSEIVNIGAAFTVATATLPAPTISLIDTNSLVQGTTNQIIAITGTNLTGATIKFSNTGISAGPATVTATSIRLPVSVAINAATGAGTVSISTGSGSASVPFSVTSIAIQAPAISMVTPDSLIQGAINQPVTIAGANLTGATVSFSNSGITGGQASVAATSIRLPVNIAANASSGAGIITVTTAGGSASGTFSVMPRASAPVLTVSALVNGSYTNNATLNISGTVTAAGGVQSVTVNNQPVTVMSDGSFTTALTLNAGANTITVIATDNNGNQKSDIRSINYDPIAPVLAVSTPADNSSSILSYVLVSGSINETSTIAITDNEGSPQSATVNGNNFSSTINLAPGVNTINIIATDLAGNTSSAKRTVAYDTSKFMLAITNPPQDMTTNRSALVLMGNVTNSSKDITVTITMAGKSYTQLVTNGIFKQRLTLTKAGLYPIAVSAKDAAGNNSTVTRNVIYRPAKTGEREDDNGSTSGTTGGTTNGTTGGTTNGTTGTVTSHPFGWTNPKSSHPNYVEKNGVNGCVSCHSIDPASKGQTMSCYNCHGKQW